MKMCLGDVSQDDYEPISLNADRSILLFYVRQAPKVCTKTICRNIELLVDHVSDVLQVMFKKTKTLDYNYTFLHR